MPVEWNPDETPRFLIMPEQVAQVRIESMSESGGTEEDPKPLIVDVKCTVTDSVDPGWKGFTVERRFWLGSKDDPAARQPSTRRTRDWVQYKRFFEAAGVKPTANTAEAHELTRGVEVMADIGLRKYEYEGEKRESNRIRAFYALGTRDMSLKGDAAASHANGFDKTGGVPRYDDEDRRVRRTLGE